MSKPLLCCAVPLLLLSCWLFTWPTNGAKAAVESPAAPSPAVPPAPQDPVAGSTPDCGNIVAPNVMNGTVIGVSVPLGGAYSTCVSEPLAGGCASVDMMIGIPNSRHLTGDDALLVLFHGQGSDEWFEAGGGNQDLVAARDELMDAAMENGMYVLSTRATCSYCCDTGSNYCMTYSGLMLHDHTAFAIEYMLDPNHYPGINRSKLYGFGWSMGGGDVMSYASRHLDIDGCGGMLAGVWCRSGTASMPAVWDLAGGAFEDLIEELTGVPGLGPDDPGGLLPYAASSAIWCRDGQPPSAAIESQSLGINLIGRPTKVTIAEGTDIASGILAFDALEYVYPSPTYPSFDYDVRVGQDNHNDWDDFSGQEVIQFFQPFGYTYPDEGDVRVVEDGRAMRFDVDRVDNDDFAFWHYNVIYAENRVRITQAYNIETVTFDVAELGLDTGSLLKVNYHDPVLPDAADLFVKGYTSAPAIGRCTWSFPMLFLVPGPNTWEWDAPTQTLILHEPHGTWCVWP